MTNGRIVITGISLSDGRLANIGLDKDDAVFTVITPHETQHYPGTGDLFASVLLGHLLSNRPFPASVEKAAAFVGKVMHDSAKIDTPARDGVALEYHLGDLISQ